MTISLKTIKRLIKISVVENAPFVASELMLELYAEYVEGWDNEAGKLFYSLLPILPHSFKVCIIHTCPWERSANEWAEKYNIPKPWKSTSEEYIWEYIGMFPNCEMMKMRNNI